MAGLGDTLRFNSLVNYRGDKLGDLTGPGKNLFGTDDPVEFSEMLNNWMTGGVPKPLDPSKIFGDQQALSGVEARASAGQGIAGLFGFGKTIGSMAPMASGVPYSAAPAPKPGLNPLFNPAYGGGGRVGPPVRVK